MEIVFYIMGWVFLTAVLGTIAGKDVSVFEAMIFGIIFELATVVSVIFFVLVYMLAGTLGILG